MEEVRRQMEAQMKEMEEKLSTVAKILGLQERDFWQGDRQQLLTENKNLQSQVFIMKGENIQLIVTERSVLCLTCNAVQCLHSPAGTEMSVLLSTQSVYQFTAAMDDQRQPDIQV